MVTPLPEPLDALFLGAAIGSLIVLGVHALLRALERRRDGSPPQG